MRKFFKAIALILTVIIVLSVTAATVLIFKLKLSIPDIINNTIQDYVFNDIVYKTINGRELKMNIYMPQNKLFTSAPAVFMFHGGSWDSGSKELDKDGEVGMLLSLGVVVISVEYRLTDSTTVFPAHMEDCADAICFMDRNAAEYGIDNKRFCVMGASAGGQLALLLALAGENYSEVGPLPIKCAVSLCSPTDFLNLQGYNEKERAEVDRLLTDLFGGSALEKQDLYAEASPINHVRPDACPIFLAHGTKDNIVLFSQAESFYEVAKKHKMNITYVPVHNADHKFQPVDGEIDPSIEDVLKKLTVFLIRYLF